MKTLLNVIGGLLCLAPVVAGIVAKVTESPVPWGAVGGALGGAVTAFFGAAVLDRLDAIVAKLGPVAESPAVPSAEAHAAALRKIEADRLAGEAWLRKAGGDPDIAAHLAKRGAAAPRAEG